MNTERLPQRENSENHSRFSSDTDGIINDLVALDRALDRLIWEVMGDIDNPINDCEEFDHVISMVRLIGGQIQLLSKARKRRKNVISLNREG